jgi:hypothetical protein
MLDPNDAPHNLGHSAYAGLLQDQEATIATLQAAIGRVAGRLLASGYTVPRENCGWDSIAIHEERASAEIEALTKALTRVLASVTPADAAQA